MTKALIAALAVVLAALAVVCGLLAGEKLGHANTKAVLAAERAGHAKAVADANAAALQVTIDMQRKTDEAISRSEARTRAHAAHAARADAESRRLRNELAASGLRIPDASCASVREYAAAAGGLLAECGAAYQGMAGEAAGHAIDSLKLQEAWPR